MAAHTECSTSVYKVTKTLRLSLYHTEKLLRTMPDLKVVHLFRDPRAVIHSHSGRKWSPIKESSLTSIARGAQAVCCRIVRDIQHGQTLVEQYPDRFKIIQYEDFENPLATIRILYNFLGMSFDEEVLQYIDGSEETGSSNSDGNHPFQYRYSMQWKTIKVINQYCEQAFDMLGYRTFKSESEFRNMSLSAVKELSFKVT